MKILLDDNKAIIDDKLEVTPEGGGYKFSYRGMFSNFVTIAEPLGSEVDTSRIEKQSNGSYAYKEEEEEVRYDPHYYLNGHNGFTVEESTERAFDIVYNERLTLALDIDRSQPGRIKDAIRTLIKRGDGRHEVYRLAGVTIKRYRDGYYKGVPFHVIFKAVVDGHMQIGFYR